MIYTIVSVMVMCILSIYTVDIVCQSGKPTFRILAPQFICGVPKPADNSSEVPPAVPGATTIRLQTKLGQQLNYNWTVRFRVLNGPRGQRFNLLVWRRVRRLERILTEMSPEIAESNSVAINNTMLLEGVDYIFNITCSNKEGVVGESNDFVIKFNDAKSEPKFDFGTSESNDQFSVLMLGSEVTYADVTYIVEAHVTPCKPTNDYYFSWSIFDLKNTSLINVLKPLGKRFVIPPGTLIGGYHYDITVQVLRIPENNVITKSGIFITVLKKGMTVTLNTEKTTIATQTPFSLSASLKNPDNLPGNLFFEWTCNILPDLKPCDNFKSTNISELNLEGGFPDEGIYVIQVTAIKGNSKSSKQAQVIVQSAMLPSIDIGSVLALAVSGQALEIQARVSDLRPGCNLQWIPIKQEGFAYLSQDDVPGAFGNLMNINSLDETFLSEIADYGNETVDRVFPLVIPAASGDWPGLAANVKYKFRLLVQCTCSASIECVGPKNVSAFSDVVFETNKPPVPKPLKVKPAKGTALQTVFVFSTLAAADLLSDYPLKYVFGYKTSAANTVTITSFIENLTTETLLPFSEKPLLPTLTVCDSRQACISIDGDPVVVLKPSKITTLEMDGFKDKFQKNLIRQEYNEGFFLASIVLETLKAMKDDTNYQSFMGDIEKYISSDIVKQMSDIRNNSNIIPANDFIKASTKFIEVFPVSDTLLQEILKLRDDVFEVVSQSVKRPDVQQTEKIVKRDVTDDQECNLVDEYLLSVSKKRTKRSVTPEDVANFLKVSEYLILTSNDESVILREKKKVLSRLDISFLDLCASSNKDPAIIDNQIIFISIEKIYLRSNIGFISLPYYPRVNKKINITSVAEIQILGYDKQTPTTVCLAKCAFAQNFLGDVKDMQQRGWIYYGAIYEEGSKKYNDLQVILKIPIVNVATGDDEILQCRKWIDGFWNEAVCDTNEKYAVIGRITYLICKCDGMGYFSLYASIKPSTDPINTDIPTKMTEPTMQPIPNYDIEIDLLSTSPSTGINIVTIENSTPQSNTIAKAIQEDLSPVSSALGLIFWIILGVTILAVLIFITKKKLKKRNKTDSYNDFVEKKHVHNGPRYRQYNANYTMEGSAESLGELKRQLNTFIY